MAAVACGLRLVLATQESALITGRSPMASVDVGIALLGYGTVGSAVNRLLVEGGDEIERATGHRLRVVRALVRDPAKQRGVRRGRRRAHDRLRRGA